MSKRPSSRKPIVTYKPLNIFLGSWNVNGKLEDFSNLDGWLKTNESYGRPDIVVIGLEEMIELSATNIFTSALADDLSKDAAQKWNELIHDFLTNSDSDGAMDAEDYCLIDSHHLVGINLTIFALRSLTSFISDVQSAVIRRGVGGLGNKGAVCIRMQIYDTNVCFVCSHLTAHVQNAAKRNEDVINILHEKVFRDVSFDTTADKTFSTHYGSPVSANLRKDFDAFKRRLKEQSPNVGTVDMSSTVKQSTPHDDHLQFSFSVNDHEVIIWCGDLNYRLEAGPTLSEVYEMISANELSYLLQIDQLNIERAAGRVFLGFDEGFIDFLPTYQFVPGVGVYDDRAEGKLRVPAWCDRVLWRTNTASVLYGGTSTSLPCDAEKIELLSYCSAPNIISDHLPIMATLRLQAKSKNSVLQEKYLLQRGRRFLRQSNQQSLHFLPSSLVLGDDGGGALCKVRLVNPTAERLSFVFDEDFLPPWLDVQPQSGAMVVSQQFTDITVAVNFGYLPNSRNSAQFNFTGLLGGAGSGSDSPTKRLSLAYATKKVRMLSKMPSKSSVNSSNCDTKAMAVAVVLVCVLSTGQKLYLPVCYANEDHLL